ncbi:MAG: uroporphyrinogen decarboxylase [Myxococcota bacterium]
MFLRACRGEAVERTPIWVMRQAGRYLPEYRDVRAKTSFLGLCKTPELAAEVTFQPIRRYGLDAAIIFSDILVPVEAMGIPLDYQPGPVLGRTIKDAADVEMLKVPDPIRDMPYVMEAVKQFVAGMPDTPLIGFAGAPFTLAAYMIEGAGSKNYAETKRFLYQQPKVARQLLSKLAVTVANHLIAQAEAGCRALQLFDSWAGYLSRDDFLGFALPFIADIVERVKAAKPDVPMIVFAKGVSSCFDELCGIGADVLGVDWTLPLDEAGRRTGNKVVLQGNLDPCVLFAPIETIERQVQRVLNEARDLKGHVFNLGHGILPPTDPEHMGALVEAVKRLSVNRVPAGLS